MKQFIACLITLIIASCGGGERDAEKGSPVSGTFILRCDESLFPVAQVLTEGYMSVYPAVWIQIDTAAGSNAYAELANGKIRSVLTSLPISESDSMALAGRDCYPRIFHFATEALVIITKKRADSIALHVPFSESDPCGSISGMTGIHRIITAHGHSETQKYLHWKFPGIVSCMRQWYAAGNQDKIVSRVATHEGEAGIVSLSYLCETENPAVQARRAAIEMVPVKTGDDAPVWPTQSALFENRYPLARKLFLATAEPYAGPATGFAAFVASDEGQRIIRLFGLAPAKTPPREIVVP